MGGMRDKVRREESGRPPSMEEPAAGEEDGGREGMRGRVGRLGMDDRTREAPLVGCCHCCSPSPPDSSHHTLHVPPLLPSPFASAPHCSIAVPAVPRQAIGPERSGRGGSGGGGSFRRGGSSFQAPSSGCEREARSWGGGRPGEVASGCTHACMHACMAAGGMARGAGQDRGVGQRACGYRALLEPRPTLLPSPPPPSSRTLLPHRSWAPSTTPPRAPSRSPPRGRSRGLARSRAAACSATGHHRRARPG
jgi:hypothetical protein